MEQTKEINVTWWHVVIFLVLFFLFFFLFFVYVFPWIFAGLFLVVSSFNIADYWRWVFEFTGILQ